VERRRQPAALRRRRLRPDHAEDRGRAQARAGGGSVAKEEVVDGAAEGVAEIGEGRLRRRDGGVGACEAGRAGEVRVGRRLRHGVEVAGEEDGGRAAAAAPSSVPAAVDGLERESLRCCHSSARLRELQVLVAGVPEEVHVRHRQPWRRRGRGEGARICGVAGRSEEREEGCIVGGEGRPAAVGTTAAHAVKIQAAVRNEFETILSVERGATVRLSAAAALLIDPSVAKRAESRSPESLEVLDFLQTEEIGVEGSYGLNQRCSAVGPAKVLRLT
jgi:hypothetical protein